MVKASSVSEDVGLDGGHSDVRAALRTGRLAAVRVLEGRGLRMNADFWRAQPLRSSPSVRLARVDRLRSVPLGYWVTAAWVSGLVALAAKAGNIAMLAQHPVRHSLLETVEALDALATIPMALLLLLLVGREPLIRALTAAGIIGMLVIAAISVAWAAEWLTFGKELIPMIAFGLAWLAILCWLVGSSLLAWRRSALANTVLWLAIATVLTGTFSYPVWAIWLALTLPRTGRLADLGPSKVTA